MMRQGLTRIDKAAFKAAQRCQVRSCDSGFSVGVSGVLPRPRGGLFLAFLLDIPRFMVAFLWLHCARGLTRVAGMNHPLQRRRWTHPAPRPWHRPH